MFHGAIRIRQSKAYVCTVGIEERGIQQLIEPIYVTNVKVEEVAEALEKTFANGNPCVPNSDTVFPKHHPLLSASGTRSWREFERDVLDFAIGWYDDKTYLEVFDASTGFAGDPAREQIFPRDAAAGIIAEAVVRYWEAHVAPELLHPVSVYVRDDHAYFPTQGKTEAGFYVDVEPISHKKLVAEQLVQGVDAVRSTPPLIVKKTRFERLMRHPEEKDPILVAVGVKTYKELHQKTVAFTLAWRTDATRLYITKASSETYAGWHATRQFEPDAPVPLLVDEVLKCLAAPSWE